MASKLLFSASRCSYLKAGDDINDNNDNYTNSIDNKGNGNIDVNYKIVAKQKKLHKVGVALDHYCCYCAQNVAIAVDRRDTHVRTFACTQVHTTHTHTVSGTPRHTPYRPLFDAIVIHRT